MLASVEKLAGTLRQEFVLLRGGNQPALGASTKNPVSVAGNPIVGRVAQSEGENFCNSRGVPDFSEPFGDAQRGLRFRKDSFAGLPVVLNHADGLRCICVETMPGEEALSELALLWGEAENIFPIAPQEELHNSIAESAEAVVEHNQTIRVGNVGPDGCGTGYNSGHGSLRGVAQMARSLSDCSMIASRNSVRVFFRFSMVALALSVCAGTQGHAQETPVATTPAVTKELDIPGDKQWTDTGIDVKIGETIHVESAGQMKYQTQYAGPQGMRRSWTDLTRSLPVNAAGAGSLIGRIGEGDAAIPFALGEKRDVSVRRSGRLFLGLNQAANESGEGSFHAKVQVLPPSAHPAVEKKIEISPEVLAQIPRRIGDMQGNPGDMVNFMIVGSREALLKTYEDAGWMLADKDKKQAVFHALTATLEKDAYLAMPMSLLYLFGRVQDFGFEHAEPVQMVQQRHHLRIWKAPMEIGGQPLWVGAATHDIGFERDQRNNGLTHKIDPAIDKEREYLGETLDATGEVAILSHVTPADPLKEAHTATGGTFFSDGQILVVQLK